MAYLFAIAALGLLARFSRGMICASGLVAGTRLDPHSPVLGRVGASAVATPTMQDPCSPPAFHCRHQIRTSDEDGAGLGRGHWLILAGVSGFLATGLGAYIAHGPGGPGSEQTALWLSTAQKFHFWHALALLAVALLSQRKNDPILTSAGLGFLLGSLLFCGGLYSLGFDGPRWLSAVVPFGGLAFLIGWACLGRQGAEMPSSGTAGPQGPQAPRGRPGSRGACDGPECSPGLPEFLRNHR